MRAVLLFALAAAAALACSSSSSGTVDASTGDGPHGTGPCTVSTDCHSTLPDECNICVSPLNHLVCVSGQCVCACRADAG